MAVTGPIAAAVVGVGGSLLASGQQSGASEDASKQQMAMYKQTRADLMPYQTGGQNAFSQLTNFLSPSGPISSLLGLGPQGSAGMQSQLQNYPGYQFAYNQGLQALDRSAASRGLLLSGAQVKDAQTYGQGQADQLYSTYLNQLGTYGNQLAGVSSLGEDAAAKTGNAGTAAAQTSGGYTAQAGTQTASGITGAANNLGSALGNSALLYQLQNSGGGGVGADPSLMGIPGLFEGTGAFADTVSDRRLKTDIRKVGKLDNGLPVYSYRLKGSALPQIGVMSDEVRKVAPHAVRRAADGYDRVNYRKVSELPALKEAA